MIRDFFSNDELTFTILLLLLFLFFLKKLNSERFNLNINVLKKEINKRLLLNDNLNFKLIDFTYSIFFIFCLSIFICLENPEKYSLSVVIQKSIFILGFFFAKTLIEYLSAVVFDFKKNSKNFLIGKQLYLNTLGILIFLFIILITYTIEFKNELLVLTYFIIISYIIYFYTNLFFCFKKLISKNLFYFILYICTLEIIPYFYLIKNIF